MAMAMKIIFIVSYFWVAMCCAIIAVREPSAPTDQVAAAIGSIFIGFFWPITLPVHVFGDPAALSKRQQAMTRFRICMIVMAGLSPVIAGLLLALSHHGIEITLFQRVCADGACFVSFFGGMGWVLANPFAHSSAQS